MLRGDRMLFTCVDTGDRMGDRMLFKCHAALKKKLYKRLWESYPNFDEHLSW